MIKLSDYPTKKPDGFNKREIKAKTIEIAQEIAELAGIMYAQKKHSLLVVFQGMDSSGKDGATRNVFQNCSPSFISAKSYKKPSDEEFDHDFLWRVSKEAP